ncbi:molybdate-anion transporter [Selaginella moellendorffii]|uniref:molybdate-anion transporter n=1 Tax=Selaginella moellendorffii TaxID=88036 RepID=UPI000D1D09DA|nr:molybdate-anion transporter [Selaginella moellendorffii]|eukprot:XP_002983842.2 molybdate-anion transporter [Selaginella moellendorffii]
MDERWRAPEWLYPCLIAGSGCALALRASISRKYGAAPRLSPTFVAFQRRFFQVFLLALVAHGFQNVYVEALYKSYGLQRKEIARLLLFGHAAAIFVGTIVAVSADSLGRKQVCLAYAVFTVIESVLKQSGHLYALCLARIFNGLASSVLPCVFETWMISEHERHGFRQEWMVETFLMMTFGGAIALLGTTAVANFFVTNLGWKLGAPSVLSAGAAVILFLFVSRSWDENWGEESQGKISKPLLLPFRDKKVVTLGLVQGVFDVSVAVFWLLWVPTIVADGREIYVGSIYVCLMASVMVGTSIAAFLSSFPLLTPERSLALVLAIASICLLVPAYDYQEIPVLVAMFCVFHICVGIATPLLACFRASYISSSRRAGVYAIYRVPTDLALILFLTQGSIRQAWDNSTILYTCGLANLAAAGGVLALTNSWKKL